MGLGVGSSVRSLAVLPSGDLIVSGSIRMEESDWHIVRWDGSNWTRIANVGIAGFGHAPSTMLVLADGRLVVGGRFTLVEDIDARGIAVWDGAQWGSFGSGFSGGPSGFTTVRALGLLPNGNLVAGGDFLLANEIEAAFIAEWDGSSWNRLDSGLVHSSPVLEHGLGVLSLAVLPGGELIAGGDFHIAGGQVSAYLARWGCPQPACYANCDASTTAPILNIADFTCFLQRFAAADGYANCDGSTTEPVLNVADFTCFLQSFAAGCR